MHRRFNILHVQILEVSLLSCPRAWQLYCCDSCHALGHNMRHFVITRQYTSMLHISSQTLNPQRMVSISPAGEILW